MNSPIHDPREAVGSVFSLDAMLHARAQTMDAVQRIAAIVQPGMTEQQACDAAKDILDGMGMQRIWHQIIVRFGENTLKTFKEKITPEQTLGANDMFFIDLGVVWDGHEGDAGDSFSVGDDAEMAACAEAARVLWQQTGQYWHQHRPSGEELYRYAQTQAEAAGWKLNLDIKGHRVSDFPHAIYKAGSLGSFDACPNTGLWILEIQIAHPARPFGAFYEDLLVAGEWPTRQASVAVPAVAVGTLKAD